MISQLEWSEEQVAVLARAERLRSYGAGRAALDLVACGCVLPTRLRVLDVPLARQLDVGRWYCALMGRPWNGDWRAFQMARDIARRRRNDIDGGAPITTDDATGNGVYRSSHLLVEPLRNHPLSAEVSDYTTRIGWPTCFDAGRLEWDDPDGFCCCFCDALLLRKEAVPVRGSVDAVCGLHCCKKG